MQISLNNKIISGSLFLMFREIIDEEDFEKLKKKHKEKKIKRFCVDHTSFIDKLGPVNSL